MRIAYLALPLVMVLCTLQTACKGRTAAPLTEQDIALLCEAGEQDDDCAALIAEYRSTGNAALATEEGTTMLHLACAAGKESLMRHLLAAGANADACSDAYGYPLTVLTERLANNGDRAQFRRLADTLQQAGAHLYGGGIFLSPELDEDTYLYLLQRFPAGQEETATPATPAAMMGWPRALAFYLEQAPHPLQGADRMLLHVAAECGTAQTGGHYVDCAKLLLQHGLAADETAGEPEGPTPLLVAAAAAQTPECGHEQRPNMSVILCLLRNGANPNRCTAGGECPYDYLVPLQDDLAAAGVTLPLPTPLEFTEGTDLLRTVLQADRRQEAVGELRTAFGQIAQVLHPTPEMLAWQQQDECYATARLAAIRLLARADALQAANAVAAMPAWANGAFFPAAAEAQETAEEELDELLQQLHELRLPLPAPIVQQLADRLCGQNTPHAAATAASTVELLAYGEDTDALLEELKQDSRLAVQAGAWQAVLLRKGLPTSKVGDMQGWMQEQGLTAATPALQRMLRLTDWGKLLSKEEEKQLTADMKAIGLADAAERLRYLNTANEAAYAPAKAEESAYVLEIATARYMLEHESDFRAAQKAAAPAQELPATEIVD